MVEYEPVDTEVQNTVDDAGVTDSTLVKADEEVTLILGEHVNGNPVTVDVQYFAALEVERELDEEEQAMYGVEDTGLHFASVLVAEEGGDASEEYVLNVMDATLDDAIDGLSQVTEEGEIDVMRTSRITYEYEDGELIDPNDIEGEGE